jgi:glycosyltransferase involved in cell wall biosynthesis
MVEICDRGIIMPKVSFILPAYKRRFLKESIDSILAQTCRDFELVIVDDKSPENLYEVIKEYRWEKSFDVLPDGGRKWIVDGIPVRYYQNKENKGGKDLVAAWNHAMEYATGEWCVLSSDDDIYHCEYLSEMIRLTNVYPDVNIVHCRNCEINAAREITFIGASRAEFESGLQMLYSSSVLRIHQRMADLMFKREAYDNIGGFPNYPMAWYTDHAFAIRLAWLFGGACSNRILFSFRNSGENISSNGSGVDKKIEAAISFLNDINELLNKVNDKYISEDDKIVLPLCARGIETQVFGLMRMELFNLKFRQFREVLKNSRLERRQKRWFLKERIVGWLNLRRYLPKWRGHRF